VNLLVYYDEDGNGRRSADEIVRVPGVDVRLGGAIGRSQVRTGNVHVEGVPEGPQLPEILRSPPYYEPSALPTIGVPTSKRVPIGLTLDIGSHVPNVYMAFGDSVTEGVGSTSGSGYRVGLAARLRSHFGAAKVTNQGILGSRTGKGAERLGASLAEDRPAYVLILYGTNDWNEPSCKYDDGCETIDNLRSMIRQCFAAKTLPIVGTIPPVNPAQSPTSRNIWVATTNDDLRLMARREGAAVAEIHGAFEDEPKLSALFYDHIHPNDAGYELIAREFFRAIAGEPKAALRPLVEAPTARLASPADSIPTP
jgi:lysophospholipase L1-like esterase